MDNQELNLPWLEDMEVSPLHKLTTGQDQKPCDSILKHSLREKDCSNVHHIHDQPKPLIGREKIQVRVWVSWV